MIEFLNVRHRYAGQAEPALDGVSVRIASGTVVALAGPNGAGKTTMLRLVAGALRPGSGTVRVDGAARPREIRACTAYAPDAGGVYPFLTADEHDAYLSRFLPGWRSDRFRLLLRRLAVPTERPARTFSRGQRARLRLGVTLARQASVWVLDEPFAGIDPESRETLTAALAGFLAEEPRTLIVATHEVGEIESLVDRVLVLADGSVRVDQDADALRQESGGSVDQFLRQGAWR